MGFTRAQRQMAGLDRRATVVDAADNSTTVYTGPCRLLGVIIHTDLSAHDVAIKDGDTTVAAIKASEVAGTVIDLFGLPFSTSLVFDPDDSATGKLTAVWEPAEDF